VIEADANHIVIKEKAPAGAKKDYFNREYKLLSFAKSNAFTSMSQIPGSKWGR